MLRWFNSLAPGCVCRPRDMIYYFSAKYFPAHKKQATLQEIFNFVQIEEESLPQAWGGFFYNGLTDASRDFLDSCAGCVSRVRTIAQAEE